MNSELVKSLNVLIDETLSELEELKKSRFSASEIKLDGPGEDGIAGKPASGSMEKEEKEKDEDEDKEDEEEDKKKMDKADEEAESDDEDEDSDEDEEEDKKEEMDKKMKKSQSEMTSLMKGYVEERMKPLESSLATIIEMVNRLSNQPVAAKGYTSRGIMPLFKSADESGSGEPLTKAQVSSKLWELKKSGTPVDSLDVTKAEMGQDLESITKKYKIS